VAVVRYSVKHRAVIGAMSHLFYAEENPAESINRIPAGILHDVTVYSDSTWVQVETMAEKSDAIVSHHAAFDKQWVHNNLLRWPWIDTCNSVDWPGQAKPGSSLVDLALAHGVAVVETHRALADCCNRCTEPTLRRV
jgi:hypothetical protein